MIYENRSESFTISEFIALELLDMKKVFSTVDTPICNNLQNL